MEGRSLAQAAEQESAEGSWHRQRKKKRVEKRSWRANLWHRQLNKRAQRAAGTGS